MQLDQDLLSQLSLRAVSLEDLEALETKTYLSTFDADDAFQLGTFIRDTVRELYPEKAVSIDITPVSYTHLDVYKRQV